MKCCILSSIFFTWNQQKVQINLCLIPLHPVNLPESNIWLKQSHYASWYAEMFILDSFFTYLVSASYQSSSFTVWDVAQGTIYLIYILVFLYFFLGFFVALVLVISLFVVRLTDRICCCLVDFYLLVFI